MEDMRAEYRRRLEERLREWKGKIEALDLSHGRTATVDKETVDWEVREMLRKKEVMKEKWKALQEADNHEWALRREELEKASEELKAALDRVAAYFK
jgi:protein-tyrosine phosphatase